MSRFAAQYARAPGRPLDDRFLARRGTHTSCSSNLGQSRKSHAIATLPSTFRTLTSAQVESPPNGRRGDSPVSGPGS